jgi:RHS repeat-associated protein
MPIDIASGSVHFDSEDFQIIGRFPIRWKRSYNTALTESSDSHLGPGWTNPYFAKLTRIGNEYHFRNSGGALIKFPDPEDTVERQGVIRDLGSFHEISKQGFYLCVTQWSVDGTLTRYIFQADRNGQWWPLRWIEDACGNGLEMAWDEQSRLKGLRQKHEKRTLVISYTPLGRIASVAFRQPDGRHQILARYDYDSKGKLTSVQDALGFIERYEYEANGRISQVQAKDGGVLIYKYDDHGRCIRSSGLDNYDLKILRYMAHIHQTEVKNSLGKSHHYQYLASGQVILHIDPMGAKTETEYDEHGRVLSKIGPLGGKTTYEYDAAGNRTKLIDALGNESLFEYDVQHLATKYVGADGTGWEKTYDKSNRPVSTTDSLGNISSIEYDLTGNAVLLKRSDGAKATRTFSESGNLIEIADWKGSKTKFSHDDFGRVVLRVDPDGRSTSTQFDLLGRTTQVTYDTGKTVKYQYDAGGNITLVTSSAESPVAFRYGTCRRLLEKKFGNGRTVKYTWGSEPDRLEKVVNEIGETYTFQYDPCDRVVAEIGFDGRRTNFKFDLAGNCISRANNLGESIDREIDLMGRMVKETIKGEEPSTFEYNKTGKLILAANAWSSIKLERDALGRVVKEDQNGLAITRQFGPLSEVLRLESDAGIHFDYTYDQNGQVLSIDANSLGQFDYTRNGNDLAISITMPGELRLQQTFDSRGRLLKQLVAKTGSVPENSSSNSLIDREYTYDETNMLVSMADQQWGKTRYTHDDAMRLTQFVSDGARTDYTLTATGDPIAILQNGNEETRFSFNPGGTLKQKGSIEYEFDGAGRLVSKFDHREKDPAKKWSYAWDAKDRLRGVTTPSGERWEYAYDPFGRRCLKKDSKHEVRFIWDNNVLLHEIEADSETRTWGFEPNSFRPLFKIQGGSLYSIVNDHLGTPREMIDAQAKVVWSAHFDPWGNPIAGKGNLEDCPLRFQGQYFDAESCLHYNRFRYYDPGVGRFISQDPILLDGGLSTYQYCPNPTHWIDPLGLCPEKLYRTMSQSDFDELQRTGRMPGTTETTTSPTQGFSEDYRGVLVEFELKPGTIGQLEAIGVSDGSKLVREKYPNMPLGGTGWGEEHARFKKEGKQINIALGTGTALDTFNDNITGYNVVRP